MANQPLKIKLQGATYTLKFGYGVLRRLSEHYKLKYVGDLGKFFEDLEISKGDLSFDAINFIGQLIYTSIQVQHGDDVEVTADEIIDATVFSNPDILAEVLEAFIASFPKDQGKQKPAQTSRSKPKKK